MSHVQYVDELVKEYLLFRGFSQTLKAFDNELKAEKEKGFRVDKIVDQLMQYIYSFDLMSLRELWGHLDTRMFSRLENHFVPGVRKLENAVLKMYLVNATVNNKQERVHEFFTKMTPELQGHSEWKEWFALPFTKNPEDNPTYSVHFSKQWQDTMLVSLHNFLATIFQCMPQPTLLTIDEDTNKLKRLQEENDALRQALSELNKIDNISDVNPGSTPQHPPIMDDFYIIAQESPLMENPKTLRSLIKNIGGGSSPILHRKSVASTKNQTNPDITVTKRTCTKGRVNSLSKGDVVSKRSMSCDSRLTRKRDFSVDTTVERKAKDKIDSNYILLSQEEYIEHKTSIIQCKSNASGSYVATGDADGIIKVWTPIPSPKTVAAFTSTTLNSNKAVTALDWISKNERYFLHGDNNGSIQLHDTRDCKTLWEIQHEGSRIVTLLCNPLDSTFVCSVSDSSESKLLLYDIKTKKLERTLPMDGNFTALCSAFNHNGQLLITGLSNGNLMIHDLRRNEIIDNLNCHSSPVIDIELINDYTNICVLSEDGKLCQRSLNQTGKILWETKIKIEKNAVQGKMFTFDQSGSHMLLCTQTGGNIYKMPPGAQAKILELGGHKGTLCCDWSTANQSGTCITGGAEDTVALTVRGEYYSLNPGRNNIQPRFSFLNYCRCEGIKKFCVTILERSRSVEAFRAGRKDILVATDVASKGLDFANVQHVINYDMPDDVENYVRRIGRTGRSGRTGIATTFINMSNDESVLLDLKHLLMEAKQKVPPFLLELCSENEKYLNLGNERGCSYCGGLGHRITECPKLETIQNKQASNYRST